MKYLWIYLFAVLLFTLSVKAEGGATTVGDGGYAIRCNGKYELFDLFENRINTGKKLKVTLDTSNDMRLVDMVAVGLQRIKHRYSLNENEFARVFRAAKMFLMDSRRDKDDSWMNSWVIEGRDLNVSSIVNDVMKQQNCQISIVAVRPQSNSYFMNVCSRNISEFEYCFLTDVDGFWSLSPGHRACLVVHEVLRFLPAGKIMSENHLRKEAAAICTQ